MPNYRYRRPDGTTFEVLQKFSDAPLTEDPETGEPVQRVISGGAGLKFNGSGFYLTDYSQKGKKPGKPASPDKPTDKSTKKPTETKAAPAKSE